MNQIVIEELRGLVAVPDQGVDSRYAVIGNSSIGTVGLGLLRGNTTPAIAAYGYGEGIDDFTHVLSRTKVPGSFCKVPNTTAGGYEAIDVALVTGTALATVSATVLPNGPYDAWIRVGTGFTVGVTGGTLQWSLDGGVNWSELTNVGTAKGFTLPNSSARINFEPPTAQVTALVAYANDIRTRLLAHIVYTTGTVHGAADSTSDDNVQAAATNLATVVSMLPTLLAGMVLHFARGTTVHLQADISTSLVAATAAVAASTASGTAQDALTAATSLATALGAHEALTSSHTIADGVNLVTAPVPTRGTLAAGDMMKTRTYGPKWAAADLYNGGASPPTGAFASLRASDTSYGLIYISGEMSAAECATVSTGLDVLNAAGKRPTVIVRSRRQDIGETEEEWVTAVKAEWIDFTDDRILRVDGEALVDDPVSARRYLRSWGPALLSRCVAVPRSEQPASPSDRPLEGVYLTDAMGTLIGHDEGPSGNVQGLDAARGCTAKRGETTTTARNVYAFHPYVLRPSDGRVFSLMVRRILNAMQLAAAEVSFASLGSKEFFDTVTLVLEETERGALAAMIAAPLRLAFADDVQNVNAANFVTINPTVTSTNGNVRFFVTISPRPFGYTDAIELTFALEIA